MKELRIIGPPGTGKTTELAKRAEQAATHYGAESVMICSLTRTAAREVAGRETSIPSRNIGTLHSLAYRALSIQEGTIAEAPKNLKLWNEWVTDAGHPHYRRSVDGSDLDEPAADLLGGMDLGDQAASMSGILRARMETPNEEKHKGIIAYNALWNRFKLECGYVDFTDLLEMSLKDTVAAPGDPAVIMADETQDISHLGIALLRHWAERAEWLVTVGDPLQCLYHWAGTDPLAFVTPDIDASQKRVLSQSYRVPRQAHKLALQWIKPLREEMEQRWGLPVEYAPKDEEGEIRGCSSGWRQPNDVLNRVEKAISAGRKCLVMASCSYMLEPFLRLCREEGLPFHNPLRPKRGDWNPLARKRGVSAVDRLLAYLAPLVREEAGSWNWRELYRWVEICEAKGFIQHGRKGALEKEAEDVGWRDEVPGDTLFSWFDVEAIVAALENAEAGETKWLLEHALSSKRKPLEYPAKVFEKRGADAIRDEPPLTIGTIHSVKGFDGADEVFLFPDLSASSLQEWEKSGDGQDGIRRMFYVALTRTRDTLHLCDPSGAAVVIQ